MKTRVLSKQIRSNDEDDEEEESFLYMKISDTTKKNSVGSEADTEHHHTSCSITIEATDGTTNFRLLKKLSVKSIKEERSKNENAVKYFPDESMFIEFIYGMLLNGSNDDGTSYEMIVMKRRNEEQEDETVEVDIVKLVTGINYGIKVFALILQQDNSFEIDLFQWFNLLSEQNFKAQALLLERDKRIEALEKKVDMMRQDNESVMKNYELIRDSTDKFVMILNEKKRKILELTMGGEEQGKTQLLQQAPLNKRKKDRESGYNLLNRSSIDLSNIKEEIKEESESVPVPVPVPAPTSEPEVRAKRKAPIRKVKQEDEDDDIKLGDVNEDDGLQSTESESGSGSGSELVVTSIKKEQGQSEETEEDEYDVDLTTNDDEIKQEQEGNETVSATDYSTEDDNIPD